MSVFHAIFIFFLCKHEYQLLKMLFYFKQWKRRKIKAIVQLCPCSFYVPSCPCFVPGCPCFVPVCPCLVPGCPCFVTNMILGLWKALWRMISFLVDGIVRLRQKIQNIILTLFKVPCRRQKWFLVDGTVKGRPPIPNNFLALLKITWRRKGWFLVDGIGRERQAITHQALITQVFTFVQFSFVLERHRK